MAGEAQFAIFHVQKVFEFGGMGGMAGKTSFFARDRGVAESHLPAFLFVAVETEIVGLLEHKLRILRRVRLMTGVAHPVFEGSMIHGSTSLQRRDVMAVVAEAAPGLSGRKRFG